MSIIKLLYSVLEFFSSLPGSGLVWLIVDEILGPICAGIIFSLLFDHIAPIIISKFFKSLSTLYIYIKKGGISTTVIKALNCVFFYFYSNLTLFNILGLFFGIVILPFILFCITEWIFKLEFQINEDGTLSMVDNVVSKDILEEELTEDVQTNTEVDFTLEEVSDFFEYLSLVILIIILIFES